LGYPRDLGFVNKGHVIQFDIREIKPAKFEIITEAISGAEQAGQKVSEGFKTNGLEGAGQAISEVTTGAYQKLSSATGNIITNIEQKGISSVSQIKWMPETYADKTDTIRLYMPDTLNFSYNAQYDKLSLAEAINSVPLVAKVSTAITSVLENKAARLLSNKLGYTFNPQQQMLFEGIDFREFDLQFTFTPTSQAESQAVKEIIKKLRYAAAPERKTSAGGFFFVPPSVFEISFFFEGNPNENITPIRPCVLQSVTVDYAPNGWSALRDGSPVQTSMSLSFKEIELIDKKSILDEK
jgi:hypothetical protein